MKTHFKRTFASGLFAILLAGTAGLAQAQSIPTERKGVNGKELAAIKLAPDFDMSKGRSLRMREVTIEPGGVLPMHSHANRPSVSYVLSGTVTEQLDGETTTRELVAGQPYETHGPRGHALMNRGSVPAVFLEVDLP